LCKPRQKFASFNLVRKGVSVESAARLIQGQLVAAASAAVLSGHPFVGREDAMRELERQVIDPHRQNTKALFVSGNFGAGRRTLIQKFYQNQFPQVGRIFPTVNIDEFSGLDELYRKFIAVLRPSLSAKELLSRAMAFGIADQKEKHRQIAELIHSVLLAREAILIIDNGGLLTDSGAFQPEIGPIIDLLQDRPNPPVAMIAPRMVPLRFRRSANDVAYAALRALDREDSDRLANRLFKDIAPPLTSEQLSDVVTLADGHPYNFYRIVEEVEQRGIASFLANTTDF
jgi:hypothetical protein